jgi:hypothetical protein
MTPDLRTLAETSELTANQVAVRTRSIYETVLSASPSLNGGNFTTVHTADLRRLFEEYDRWFFQAQIGATLGDIPLRFRLSKRMTSAGGKTARYTPRHHAARPLYEISVSTTLLFHCFTGDDHRPITAAGLSCHDRLEALQRVMEHELVHLVEMLLWTRTSCAARRFQSIASRFFAHRGHTHTLVTPGERAFAKFGITRGSRVRFRHDGEHHTGVVRRITKRATVLVSDPGGALYSDGNRYATYYVPVELLELVATPRVGG